MDLDLRLENYWKVKCFKPDGTLRWADEFKNIVVNVGLAGLLNNTFNAIPGSVSWFVGLIDGTSTPAYAGSDTMASHPGWTVFTGFSQATRPAWTPNAGGASGAPAAPPTMSNSSALATFSINATGNVAGGFLVSDSTKAGTTGTLYGEGNFSATRAVFSGDTMTVEVDLSAITQ